MTSSQGVPLEVIVSGANEHDVNLVLPLVYLGIPGIGGVPGRPREYPAIVRADCGDTSKDVLAVLEATGIESEIPQRGHQVPDGLGKRRWPVSARSRGRSNTLSHAFHLDALASVLPSKA